MSADPLEITGTGYAAVPQYQAAVQADGGARRLGPVLHLQRAHQDQDRRPDLPDQQAGAAARGRAHHLLRPDDAGADRLLPARAGDRLRDLRARPGPLPRRYFHPARLPGHGAALHHRRHAAAGQPRAAGDADRSGDGQARPGADGRLDRFGQVHHAGGDDQSPQRDRSRTTSSRSRIRSSSCTATSARSSISARSAWTPRATIARCAASCARRPT